MRLNNYFDLAAIKKRRKVWLDIHLWLGLILGLFMAIFGLTGSILVFHTEINEWMNPELMTVAPPADNPVYQPIDVVVAAADKVLPKAAQKTFATYPRNAEAAFKFNYSLTFALDVTESWEVYVNPYTAEVTGKKLMSVSDNPFPKAFIGFIFELQYALFLGEVPGYLLVAAMSAFLMISVLSGLISGGL
jgi:uncharacterized iron-regulated membrane protein